MLIHLNCAPGEGEGEGQECRCERTRWRPKGKKKRKIAQKTAHKSTRKDAKTEKWREEK